MSKVSELITAALNTSTSGDMTTTDVAVIFAQLDRAYRQAFRDVDTEAMTVVADLQRDLFCIASSGRASAVCALSMTHANRMRERMANALMELAEVKHTLTQDTPAPEIGIGLCIVSALIMGAIFYVAWITYKFSWLIDLLAAVRE